MKFDTPAETNPIDRGAVVGKPHPRIEGPLKTTGTATYSYEHKQASDPLYGYVVAAGIAKGCIAALHLDAARASPGVVEIVTADSAGPIGGGGFFNAPPLGGPDITHYHQAIALVVAETFEQARAGANLVQAEYDIAPGAFDLEAGRAAAAGHDREPDVQVGDFEQAFAAAPVRIDQTYSTPDHSHFMLEPHATIAKWDGDEVTIWSAQQILGWARRDLAGRLGMAEDKIRIVSTFLGGGFGGKGSVLADAVLAVLGARMTGRAVKVTLQREIMPNNTTHRAATIQRVRLGSDNDGRLTAIAHETWSGNLAGGGPEFAASQSELLYAGAHRMMRTRLATLDLPEANAMRAPGEAPGMMALEIAMDELAETLGLDPVELRIRNDTQTVPGDPDMPFSERHLVECLREGASRFGWDRRSPAPGSVREGRLLIGMGMAAAIRGAPIIPARARATLDASGQVVIECNMTDMGTGSYTVLGQVAAEMMGVPLERVTVRLGDSRYPDAFGGGGQAGAPSAAAGVFAACTKLREAAAHALGFNDADVDFAGGEVCSSNRRIPLSEAARSGPISVEESMEYGDLSQRFSQQTYGAHFCEVSVDADTGEIRLRRMLAVCDIGRVLNPLMARSQVIGAMVMGAGAALMETLEVDRWRGFFVNHDFASYEVPVHADIPHQDVIFLDTTDPTVSPVKAKGVGELGISGVAPAIANAVYNATGVRVRDYPITLDKHLARLPVLG